jgi:hypothetical protein
MHPLANAIYLKSAARTGGGAIFPGAGQASTGGRDALTAKGSSRADCDR